MREYSHAPGGRSPHPLALLPILVFLIFYLGSGIYFTYIRPVEDKMGFYVTSVVVAFGLALIVAFFQGRRRGFEENIRLCAWGIGDENIVIMLFIFLLAGAFSGLASSAGGARSVAGLLLDIIPGNFAIPGLFLIACLVSMAMGTSVGTITVLVPIAVEVAQSASLSRPLIVATVVGGAMFGDNLSFISDTTIAATKTQGVEMKDKFRTNLGIALPAAMVTLVILMVIALRSPGVPLTPLEHVPIMALPYFVVLALALLGINVFLVLLSGILLFFLIGCGMGVLTIPSALAAMGSGTQGMFESIIVTILVASLSSLMKEGGGFEAILSLLRSHAKGRRGGMGGIFLLTGFMDIATANNTVAIVVAAPIAREITQEYGIPPKKTASLLDTASCIFQGIIPYGAQLLVASSLSGITSVSIIPFLFYPFLLLIAVLVSIVREKG